MIGNVKVSILVLAFNHEAYIRRCLDGILMQKVRFPFEVLVHDDASKDGTPCIIQEYFSRYPGIIKPIFQTENKFSLGIPIGATFLYPIAQGDYIAECEGDDYWTDPNKLQEQVSFLESHPDYGFVGTNNEMLNPDGTIVSERKNFTPISIEGGCWELYGDVFDSAKYGPITRTLTLCFRKSIIMPYLEHIKGDLILETILAKHSYFANYNRSTAVYRNGVGISGSHNSLEKQLRYNDWFITNRRIQKLLFPEDCNWNDDELSDRGEYINLRIKIRDRNWREALEIKKSLRSSLYKNKTYSKYLFGPISCLLLSSTLRRKRTS